MCCKLMKKCCCLVVIAMIAGAVFYFLCGLKGEDMYEEGSFGKKMQDKKKKVKQPAQKGSKARSIEKVTVEQLLKSMENTSFPSMTSLTHPSLRFTVMSF